MKNQLAFLAILLVCAAQGYFRSQPTPPEASLAHHLSINGVRLGMTRSELVRRFGNEQSSERGDSGHFGTFPDLKGIHGNSTDVKFDSDAANARVITILGANLSYDGVLLCPERWDVPNPGTRSAAVKQKLGEPDQVTHSKMGVYWIYDRYQLTIDTSLKYPWHFYLGSHTSSTR